MPEMIEFRHVTGQDGQLTRIVTRDLQHLENFAGSLNQLGETRTAIVLSHPIRQRPLSRPPLPDDNLLDKLTIR